MKTGYGKGPATGYSDFYKNNTRTPVADKDDVPDDAEERKKAIQRRLKMKKAGPK